MTTRPDDATLRRLRRDEMSQKDIAQMYGVTRQTVANWLDRAGLPMRISRHPQQEPMSHKRTLPWKVRGDDHHDLIARALRWWDAAEQGVDLTPQQQREVDRLVDFLRRKNVVVDYDYDTGFVLRPRRDDLDEPDDIIRRPALLPQ